MKHQQIVSLLERYNQVMLRNLERSMKENEATIKTLSDNIINELRSVSRPQKQKRDN